MSGKPRPAYLRLVPPPGKRFRPPRKPGLPAGPLHHDPNGKAIAGVIRQAELVEQILESLESAARGKDWWATFALTERIGVEVRCAAAMARNLRDCPVRE